MGLPDGVVRFAKPNLGGSIDSLRNKRSVWSVTTKPFSGAHFATFPPDLITPCILAGTSEHGVCSACGAPYYREVARTPMVKGPSARRCALGGRGRTAASGTMLEPPQARTVGWRASCKCAASPAPAVALDPFMGAGTVAAVCQRAGRRFLGVELNPTYIKMAERRLAQGWLL